MTPYNFADLSQSGGVKTTLLHNLNAVKLLRQLDSEDRHPTEPERDILARFVGWGTVASVINREVLELLPNSDLNSDNAFQTSRDVIEAIWAVVEHLGFKSGRILEPAANIGLFPGFQNPEYRSNSEWVLVEIDPTAAAIALARRAKRRSPATCTQMRSFMVAEVSRELDLRMQTSRQKVLIWWSATFRLV